MAESQGQDLVSLLVALPLLGFAVPDSRVGFSGDNRGIRHVAVGGSYGLGVIELDDGRIIALVFVDDADVVLQTAVDHLDAQTP